MFWQKGVQRAKLDAQAETRLEDARLQVEKTKTSKGKRASDTPLAKRRAATTIARAVEDYINDHEGGNHSPKTLQWHRTSLGLLQHFLQEEREITPVGEVDAPTSAPGSPICAKPWAAAAKFQHERERLVQEEARLRQAMLFCQGDLAGLQVQIEVIRRELTFLA